ncbi:MAG: glycosyltransferase family 4 protein [Planctomycetota bacterium]
MRIAIITAGAAGMYCGSCLSDNALARALHQQGHDVQLIPLYTPIRTDVPNAARQPVFLGGINLYLRQKYTLARAVPRWLTGWLDHPWLINQLANRAVQTEASELGDLTVAVLQAERGVLSSEFDRLTQTLVDFDPDVVHFSNIMIAGAAMLMKQATRAAMVVTLQGDDIFLDELPAESRAQVVDEIRNFEHAIDAYVAHSQFYASKMSQFLGLPLPKIHVRRLATELDDLCSAARVSVDRPPRLGYLARLAPEKGLHLLCEAFAQLRRQSEWEALELHIAGYQGKQHEGYVASCVDPLREQYPGAVRLWGDVDRQQKIDFLREVDVISVPSPYEDPKGLYVLEALAAGVPVVQPDHGAFPELMEVTGGGRLFKANAVDALASELADLLGSPEQIRQLADAGKAAVCAHHTSQVEAREMVEFYQQLLHKESPT